MENSGEDTRNNKRDCPHDDDNSRREQEQGGSPGEHCKKLRESNHEDNINKGNQSSPQDPRPQRNIDSHRVSQNDSITQPVDIETALARVFQNKGSDERLSDKTSVTFRVGHAGDASAIAACYAREGNKAVVEQPEANGRAKAPRNGESSSSPSSSLELWLSEAMGDEDKPPSVFFVLADVSYASSDAGEGKAKPTASEVLGAVALLTMGWINQERVLQLDWLHLHRSLPGQEAKVLTRRLWLRLSVLALMIGAHFRGTQTTLFDDFAANIE